MNEAPTTPGTCGEAHLHFNRRIHSHHLGGCRIERDGRILA